MLKENLCDYFMTEKYNQLNLSQRHKIKAYLASGKSQSEISILLGVHKSTVIRELPQLQTMTFDNDQAFSQHEKIAEVLKINAYFTKP